MVRNLAASAQWLGADRILWASNYPHPRYSDRVLATLVKALVASVSRSQTS